MSRRREEADGTFKNNTRSDEGLKHLRGEIRRPEQKSGEKS